MSSQPSEDNISALCSIVGISREDAIRRLKGNNNDLNAAMNDVFDDPAGDKYKYDENAFASDRDGTVNNAGISFQVQGPDDDSGRAPGYYSTAPSRPPSRSSDKSPFNSQVISLAAEHAAADPTSRLTEADKVDLDLQRALQESAQEAGLEYEPQQYGVTEGPIMEKYFGPANRPTYNQSEWAMVPGGSYVTEILPDPDPEHRTRKPGTPAFLKPLVDDNRLPALLTIYHSIPLAREALLSRDSILPDYGHNPEWWAGKPIESRNPIVVQETEWTDEWGQASKQDYEEFMRELQRLIAFLSETDRAYGSVDALTKLAAYYKPNVHGKQGNNDEEKALFAWDMACVEFQNQDQKAKVLFTTGIQPLDSWGVNASDQQEHVFAVLDLELPTPDELDLAIEPVENIYDLTDRLIWNDSGLTPETSAYLDTVGDVISFRIKGSNKAKMIRIPSVWYADRYLKQNVEAALEMRRNKDVVRAEMQQIEEKVRKLTYITLPTGKRVKVKNMLATAMRHDENAIPYEGQMEHEMATASKSSLNLTEELQKLMNNIDKKIESLELEKDKVRATLREMSKLYTESQDGTDHSPVSKYTLRGVSVSKYVTFLKRPLEEQLIEFDDENGNPQPREQWWKIEYSTTGVMPVSVTEVTENEVLLSAYRDSTDCLAVYATDEAMAHHFAELPEPLKNFVRADNLAFSGEFPAINEPEEMRVDNISPRSPKRKFDDSSENSAMELTQIRGPPPPYPALVDNFSPPKSSPNVIVSEKEVSYGFPLPPSYNAIVGPDPADVQEYEKRSRNDGREMTDYPREKTDSQEMQEMQTKANIPSLLPKSSEASEATVSGDAMDVDDLASPAPKEKET